MHTPTPLAQHLRAEIDMLRPQFQTLYPSMDIDAAVALWVGKPNRFTQTVMHSVQDVLHYMSAEHAEAQARAQAPGPAQPGAPAQPAHSGPQPDAPAERNSAAKSAQRPDRVVRDQQVAEANQQWREAVAARRAAMIQWDQYVAALRQRYQELKKG